MEMWLSWYQQFVELSKINPVMGGLVGVWVAAVTTYLCRNVPMRIWGWIKRNSTRHMQLTSVGPDGPNRSYSGFLEWFSSDQKRTRFVRSWQFSTVRDGGKWVNRTNPGYARHYFFYKWRLCWFVKRQLDSQGTDIIKEQLDITVVFGSDSFLKSFIEDFKYREPEKAKRKPRVYIWKRDNSFSYWDNIKELSPRRLNTVAIKKSIRDSILREIELFMSRRDWYMFRGIPYKATFELSGPSGTGKTSFVRAVATHLNLDLYILRLTELNDKDLQLALSKVPTHGIILVEDYDSCEVLLDRKKLEATLRANSTGELDYKASLAISSRGFNGGPTLTGVLNAFDGVIPLDGQIVFWTTNHPEKIDEAVRRAGRMDHKYVLGDLHHEDIVEFIRGLFDSAKLPAGQFCDINGSQLSNLLIAHADDLQKFVDSIPFQGYYDGAKPLGNSHTTFSITAHFDDATYRLDGSGTSPRVEPPLPRGITRFVRVIDEAAYMETPPPHQHPEEAGRRIEHIEMRYAPINLGVMCGVTSALLPEEQDTLDNSGTAHSEGATNQQLYPENGC